MVNKKNLFGAITIGLVLVLIQAFILVNVGKLFPTDTERWRTILFTYTILTAFVFSWGAVRSEKGLFQANLFKALPKLLLSAGVTFIILFALGYVLKGNELPSVRQAIAGIGIPIIIFHCFIVAFNEELIFRGFFVDELRSRRLREGAVKWTQAIVFALFHYGVTGGAWLVMVLYVPLAFVWLYLRDRYSPLTNMANIGSHAIWNIFILGFLS